MQPPQSGLLPINRHPRGGFKGLEGSSLNEIERIERKKEEREKEEEERRGNEAEMLPNRDRNQPLRRFLFCVLRVIVS